MIALLYYRLKWRVGYWIWVKRGRPLKVLPGVQVTDETHVWDAAKVAEVERWLADRPGRSEDTA